LTLARNAQKEFSIGQSSRSHLWVQSIVMTEYVCLSVHSHNSKTIPPIPEHVDCGRDSVFLRRRCDTLCTSGFVDNVMFSYQGAQGNRIKHDVIMFRRVRQVAVPVVRRTTRPQQRSVEFVIVQHRDEVCYIRLPCHLRIIQRPHTSQTGAAERKKIVGGEGV